VGTVTEIVYTSQRPSPHEVYRCEDDLVVLPGASFPDICVGCGEPAWGNVTKRTFYDLGELCLWLPSFWDIVAFLLRKEYLFSFPFCSNCPQDMFQIEKTRLDGHLSVFSGASKALVDSLPIIPPDVEAEKNRSWLKRRFRWFLG
jgi:hypothetical protein